MCIRVNKNKVRFRRQKMFSFWFGLFSFNKVFYFLGAKSFASIICKCFLLESLLWTILKRLLHWIAPLIRSSNLEVFLKVVVPRKQTKSLKNSCEKYSVFNKVSDLQLHYKWTHSLVALKSFPKIQSYFFLYI